MHKISRRSRKLYRLLVPIAALPLALTSVSGAIYGTVLSFNMDAPWLLLLHTGNFGVINLQPIYSPLIGVMTLVLVASGIALLVGGRRTPNSIQD
jgi:ABC-type Na+ efflux pump permease subunit